MRNVYRVAGVLMALVALVACERSPGGTVPAQSLQVYSVPPAQAEPLRLALDTVLGKNGTTSLVPPDKLLVLAPQPLQDSVKASLGQLTATETTAVSDARPVRLTLWIVKTSDTASSDLRLSPLQGTLDAIRGPLAAQGFELLSQLSITSTPSGRAMQQVSDLGATLQANLSPAADGVNADLRIESRAHVSIATQTQLRFGQSVVIAQASPEESGRVVQLMIVQADPAE